MTLGSRIEPLGVSCAGMTRRDLRLLLVVCALGVAWLIAGNVIGLGVGFMFLAPALVLALPLLAGRYVGADRLSRLERTRPRRTRGCTASPPASDPWQLVPPRGGLLIAASLAVRPPPLPAAPH
jgi:ABC-type antimicrobial peptide transport system permease subunit